MTARNALTHTPPYAVDQTLRRLGADLRTARLRRNLTLENVAQKIGAGVRPIMDAEKGKPSTGAVVYAALLWTYGLVDRMSVLADPATDQEGLALSLSNERQRARNTEILDDQF